MDINNYHEIVDYCIAFLEDDYTELWVFVSKIKNENPQFSIDELMQATETIIQAVIRYKHIYLVDFGNDEKEVKKEIQDIHGIIKNTFKKNNRVPTIGDGPWFTI